MSHRILIVDDHPIVRQGLREILSHHMEGPTIGEAANGDELGERVRGRLGRLAAVGQRADFDARHSALCAFFAAW